MLVTPGVSELVWLILGMLQITPIVLQAFNNHSKVSLWKHELENAYVFVSACLIEHFNRDFSFLLCAKIVQYPYYCCMN